MRKSLLRFQSTRPVWGATADYLELPELIEFQSTRPVWGATRRRCQISCSSWHFNPRAPCGARPCDFVTGEKADVFQSTRPVWGATSYRHEMDDAAHISIHAPRVGRDDQDISRSPLPGHFNPRAPCGARRFLRTWRERNARFQSTRPVWGATFSSPRARANTKISIHAPRVGRDFVGLPSSRLSSTFQSTRPVWGATRANHPASKHYCISIHAPRVGRDSYPSTRLGAGTNFNPRAPCGARLEEEAAVCGRCIISIHAPRVGRDDKWPFDMVVIDISIHAPRVGRDTNRGIYRVYRFEFQSTRPVWGAT